MAKNEMQDDSKSVDMYSELANQLDQNRQERYEHATMVVNQTMEALNLSAENEQIKEAQELAEANKYVEDPDLPRALRNPKSKSITLLQCFGIMLVMLGIQLVVGLPIGSIIANDAKYEALQVAETAEEFFDTYMEIYMQRFSEATGSFTLIVTVMSLIIGLIWYVRGYVGKNAVEKFKQAVKKTCTPRMFGIIVLLGLGLQFGMAVVAAIEDLVVPAGIVESYEETFGMAGLSSFAGIMAVVVAAPINEELFFRGIIYRKMKTAWFGIGPVVAAALLFSLMHMIPYQVIYTIPAGFALAYIAKRYGSVLPGILIHMCVNGFSFGVQILGEKMEQVVNSSMITLIYLALSMLFIGGAVVLMRGENKEAA